MNLRLGVILPQGIKPKKQPINGHNKSEGEFVPKHPQQSSASMEFSMNQAQPMPVSNHVGHQPPISEQPVIIETAPAPEAPVDVHTDIHQSVSLQEVLRAGIRIHGPAERTLTTRALDAGTTAAGVAAGIGLAAGIWALGNLVVGLFTSEGSEY